MNSTTISFAYLYPRQATLRKCLRTDFKVSDHFYHILVRDLPGIVLIPQFAAWRRLLKDLITYFREVQATYEIRSKALVKLSSTVNSLSGGRDFLSEGGLNDAVGILRGYTAISVSESNKARAIQEDVIAQLTGLRTDLNQKIKEIKSLSGDFKNSVERERDNTKRAVEQLKEALTLSETNPAAASGKGDPFIVRLVVERQVEKQIDEENYLHRVSRAPVTMLPLASSNFATGVS